MHEAILMTICMIAQAVDEKGEPVLLIRADIRFMTVKNAKL